MDGIHDGTLHGWVMLRSGKPARVGLYAGGELLAETPVNLYRSDLHSAGLGDGWAGFVFGLSSMLRDAIQARGGLAEVRVMDVPLGRIGVLRVDRATSASGMQVSDQDRAAHVTARLGDATETLARLKSNVANRGGARAVLDAPRPSLRAHAPMFADHSAFSGRPCPRSSTAMPIIRAIVTSWTPSLTLAVTPMRRCISCIGI